jgi:hypothetical protein
VSAASCPVSKAEKTHGNQDPTSPKYVQKEQEQEQELKATGKAKSDSKK